MPNFLQSCFRAQKKPRAAPSSPTGSHMPSGINREPGLAPLAPIGSSGGPISVEGVPMDLAPDIMQRDAVQKLGNYSQQCVLVPFGSPDNPVLKRVQAYKVWDGIWAANGLNMVSHQQYPDVERPVEELPPEEMLQFVEDTLAYIKLLTTQPNGDSLVGFFAENRIIHAGQMEDRRITIPGGGKLDDALIICPSRSQPGPAVGIPKGWGRPCCWPLSPEGSEQLSGSPSIIQYYPRRVRFCVTGDTQDDIFWLGPFESLAHEMVHAIHNASGTGNETCECTICVPEEGLPSATYEVSLEELYTHSRPYARACVGDRDGITEEATISVNGVPEQVRLSMAEVRLGSGLLEKAKAGSHADAVYNALVSRKKMFGIGEWQILQEFGIRVRPMYSGPQGRPWKYVPTDLPDNVPIELLKYYCDRSNPRPASQS